MIFYVKLGIEIGDDPKSCNSEREESNSLMQKYREMEEQLKTLVFEREHTEGEYRHYIDNLKEELRHIRSEVYIYYYYFNLTIFINKFNFYKSRNIVRT